MKENIVKYICFTVICAIVFASIVLIVIYSSNRETSISLKNPPCDCSNVKRCLSMDDKEKTE